MARKNPFGKITETALSSIKNPGGTSGKVVERAKGTAALGKMVAEQVGRSALSKASGAASAVVDRAKRRKSSASSLRSVPVVNEPGHTPAENEPPGPVHVTAAEESAEPRKVQGDPVPTSATAKAPAKVAPTKKAPAKKAPAKKSTATKTPTKASSAKKSPAPSPADVAQVVESAVAEDPKKTAAKKTTAKKTTAKKTTAKKTTAKKTTAKKTPAKKSPTKKAASKKAASKKTPTEKSAEANPE